MTSMAWGSAVAPDVEAGEPVCPCCGGAGLAPHARFSSGDVILGCDSCRHHHLARGGSSPPVAYNDHYSGFREDPVFARAVAELVDQAIVPRLPRGSSVLDLGCGNGAFLAAAAAAGYRAAGLDTSQAAVQMCRERGFDATCGDFMDGAVAGTHRGVDLVTLWDVLEHLPDPHAFLAQVARTLRPGGWLFIKTPAVEWLSLELTRLYPRAAGALLTAPAHVQFFRRTSLTALLLRSGFGKLQWLPSRSVRGPLDPGSLRKQIARRVVAGLHRASGDGNLLVFART